MEQQTKEDEEKKNFTFKFSMKIFRALAGYTTYNFFFFYHKLTPNITEDDVEKEGKKLL